MSCESYTSSVIYNGIDLSQEFPNIGLIELKSCEDMNQIIFDLWQVLITVGTGTVPPLNLVLEQGSTAELISEFVIDGLDSYGSRFINQDSFTIATTGSADARYPGAIRLSSENFIFSANSDSDFTNYIGLSTVYNGLWEISFGSSFFGDYTEAVRIIGTPNTLANKGYVDYVIANLPTSLRPKGSIGAVSGNDLPTTGMTGGDTYWCDSDNFTSAVTGVTYNRGDMIIWSEVDVNWFYIPSTDAEYANKTLNETITGAWTFTNSVSANLYFGDGSNLTGVAKPSDIPTLVSELTNDSGYITSADLTGYLQSGDNVSELTNDAGYLTSVDLTGYLQSGDDISLLNNDSGYITGIDSADVINALGYTPANVLNVPTLLSQLTNDVGYITGINSSDVINALGYTPANTAALAAIAFSGSYSDLIGAPTNVSAFTNDAGYITSIPSTYLQSGDNVSELTNDAGYLVATDLSGYLPLTAGTTKRLSGDLFVSKAKPQIFYEDNTTNTWAKVGIQSDILYITSGSQGAGNTATSGDIRFSGLGGGTDIGEFSVRYGGSFRNILHSGNLSTELTNYVDTTTSQSIGGNKTFNNNLKTLSSFTSNNQIYWGGGHHKLFNNDGGGNSGIRFGWDYDGGNIATETGRPWAIKADNDDANGDFSIVRSLNAITSVGESITQDIVFSIEGSTGVANFNYTPTILGVDIATTNDLSGYVDLTTNQTIGGSKTFSASIVSLGNVQGGKDGDYGELHAYSSTSGYVTKIFTSTAYSYMRRYEGALYSDLLFDDNEVRFRNTSNVTKTLAFVDDLSGYLPLTGGSGSSMSGDMYFRNSVYLRALTTAGTSTRIHGINAYNNEYIGSVDTPVVQTNIGNNTNLIVHNVLNQTVMRLDSQYLMHKNYTLLGTTAGDYKKVYEQVSTGNSNNFYVREWLKRDASGSDWQTVQHVNGISIDGSYVTPDNSRCNWKRDPAAESHVFGSGTSSYLQLNNSFHTFYREVRMGYQSDGTNRDLILYTSGNTWGSTGGVRFINKTTSQSAYMWIDDSNQLWLQNSSTSARAIRIGNNGSPVYMSGQTFVESNALAPLEVECKSDNQVAIKLQDSTYTRYLGTAVGELRFGASADLDDSGDRVWHDGNSSVRNYTSYISLGSGQTAAAQANTDITVARIANGGTATVNLPSAPNDGDTVWLNKLGAQAIVVSGNGNNVYYVGTTASSFTTPSFFSTYYEIVWFDGMSAWFVKPIFEQ